jgi:methylase of polypeptide subunit release factors
MDENDKALLSLGRELRARNYHFITPTPATHHRVSMRSLSAASPLERIFGWSLPFAASELPPAMLTLLANAEELDGENDRLRSKIRFSSIGEQLFVHSGFPTDAADSVFFGPDTYRFVRALRHAMADLQAKSPFTVVDVGAGSGAGGICAALFLNGSATTNVILSDINRKALRYSAINASLNGIARAKTVRSDLLEEIDEVGDLIIANPPYLIDRSRRVYRHGGGEFGLDLSVRIVEQALERLRPGGRLFLYTGTPVINGADLFRAAVEPRLRAGHCSYSYEEIDPDVFGEELDNPPYDRTDRIAVIGLTVDIEKERRHERQENRPLKAARATALASPA